MRRPLIISAAALTLSSIASASASVTIANGTVQGATCPENPKSVSYYGIPFAKPPTGDLRFAPPQPYGPDKYPGGTLNATTPPPTCYQFATGDPFVEPPNLSEDCLFLNIWAPANATASSALPVRVWIHGGSQVTGGISHPLFVGCNVTDTNAVQVSIAYRLGPLGFLTLESAGFGGNQAIQDMLLGLQWIQENIAAFGGDPKHVLLMGQSAGAIDVFTIASLPQAPKLFSAAAIESGGGRDNPYTPTISSLGVSFAQTLNCSASDAACFRNAPISAILEAQKNNPLIEASSAPSGIANLTTREWFPHVDGVVIPKQPKDAGVQVPSIIGYAAQDNTLAVVPGFLQAPGGPESATEANYTDFINASYPPSIAAMLAKAYPISAYNSTPYPPIYAMAAIGNAAKYKCPAYVTLRSALRNNVKAWAYEFAYVPHCLWIPGAPQQAAPLLGATHTVELPFVFGQTKGLPRPNGTCDMTPEEQALSAYMNGAWTALPRDGSPSDKWPTFDNNGTGVTFANATSIPGQLDWKECDLWDEIFRMQREMALNGTAPGAGNATTAPPGGIAMPMTDIAARVHDGMLLALAGAITASVFFLV